MKRYLMTNNIIFEPRCSKRTREAAVWKHHLVILFVLLAILLLGISAFGQDPNYSQWLNTPVYYNPAFTGLNKGMRAKLSYRDQWPNLPVDYRTMYFSADLGDRSLPGAGGFGLIINSDNQSFGFIKNLSASLTLSARIPMNAWLSAQVGIKGGIMQKSMNWDDFVFSDQLNDRYGNITNTQLPPPDVQQRLFPDFGAGGLLQFAALDGQIIGTTGFAVDHVFEPDESFYNIDRSRLPRKYVGHLDVMISLGEGEPGKSQVRGFNDPLRLNPGILYQNQNNLSSIQAGINALKYNIYLGCYYQSTAIDNNSSSLMILAGYRYVISDQATVKFMYSYDVELSGKMAGTGGAHEISLILELSTLKLFGKNRYEECPALKSKEIKFTRLECSPF
ncbi:MAG: PorP/SprF family type IX secretion system membrane protein [Bacteroidota bacterium]